MDSAAFIQRLNQIKNLPVKTTNAIVDGLRTNRFDAQETFLSPGNYATSIYFVQTGIVRGAIEGPFGKMSTWFKQEDGLFVPQGLFNQQSSEEYISAITNATLLSLPLKHLQKVSESYPEVKELAMLLIAESAAEGRYRERLLRIPAAKDRYAYLSTHEDFILKRVPHYMIASYLNVTKETFSRIHKGLAY